MAKATGSLRPRLAHARSTSEGLIRSMRPGQNRRLRGRTRNKGPNPLTRTYESNGPDVKIRGTAQHVADKYAQLARDAQASGDPISSENYFQHAEHYYRMIAAAQEAQRQQYGGQRPFDEDGEEGDEDGATGFGNQGGQGADDYGEAPYQPSAYEPRPAPPPRFDRNDRQNQNRPQQRYDRNGGGERYDRNDRQERFNGGDQPNRNDRPDQGERFDRAPRQDRNDRPYGGGERGGYDRQQGQERPGGERQGQERQGPERQGQERQAVDRQVPERQTTERQAPERQAPERQAPERHVPDPRQAAERQNGERYGDRPDRQNGERYDRNERRERYPRENRPDRGEYRADRQQGRNEPRPADGNIEAEAPGLPAFLTAPVVRQPIAVETHEPANAGSGHHDAAPIGAEDAGEVTGVKTRRRRTRKADPVGDAVALPGLDGGGDGDREA